MSDLKAIEAALVRFECYLEEPTASLICRDGGRSAADRNRADKIILSAAREVLHARMRAEGVEPTEIPPPPTPDPDEAEWARWEAGEGFGGDA